jgi:hypothetical protein
LKHYENQLAATQYSSRAFQWYEERIKRHHGLGDLNMTNKQNDTNKLPSFIDIFLMFLGGGIRE